MSNATALSEALESGWLDDDDLMALCQVPIDERFRNEAERHRFYGLELEGKCAMIREMIWDTTGRHER